MPKSAKKPDTAKRICKRSESRKNYCCFYSCSLLQALHCWLTRVLYNRRSKFDPLWNVIIVAGMQVLAVIMEENLLYSEL